MCKADREGLSACGAARAAAYRSGRGFPPQRARRTAAGPTRRADHTAPRAQRTAPRAEPRSGAPAGGAEHTAAPPLTVAGAYLCAAPRGRGARASTYGQYCTTIMYMRPLFT